MADPAARSPRLERPDLYVSARFLDALVRGDRRFTKTQLQLVVRLNYDVFLRYLDYLQDRGYVRRVPSDDGPERIEVTDAGRRVHEELVRVLRAWFRPGANEDGRLRP